MIIAHNKLERLIVQIPLSNGKTKYMELKKRLGEVMIRSKKTFHTQKKDFFVQVNFALFFVTMR